MLPASAQIRITEVGVGVMFEGNTKWVELHNAGDSEEDVAALLLCNFPLYPSVGSLTALGGGSTTIPAGGYLVVSWADIGDDDAEVGIYTADASGDFGNADKLIDYMQYGTAEHRRETVGEAAGIWTAGEFVPLPNEGESLQLVDVAGTGASNWVSAAPTPGEANASGSAVSNIRITEVGVGVMFEGNTKWVELHNAGDSEEDVAALLLCNFPLYPSVGSLTALGGGSTTIPAGGYLVVSWADIGDEDAEVGIYTADATGDFGNAEKLLDYMQYGTAEHRRETVGEAAGLWTAGEFVPLPNEGETLQLVDVTGTGLANWVSAAPTPNAPTNVTTSVEEESGVPASFTLHTNYPNPFNPETSIRYELMETGSVQLTIYDMLGQQVTELVNNVQAVGSHTISWDGSDGMGNIVPSGMYLYRMTFNGRASQSRIMTLLK